MPSSLKIASLNINSLISNQKRNEILNFSEDHNPDLMLISETKLKQQHKISFKEYNIIRNDRTFNTGGGTAILVKKSINFETINIPPLIAPVIETTTIATKVGENKTLFVVAIYVTKEKSLSLTEALEHIFNHLELHNENNYFYIAGDFNAKHSNWKNPENNTKGYALNKFIEDNNIKYRINLYHTELPSFKNANSYIDLVLADSRLEIMDLNANNNINNIPIDSDHDAIITNITTSDMNLPVNDARNERNLDWKKADWNHFKEILKNKTQINIPHDRNLNLDEIEKYNVIINKHILEALKKAVPVKESYNSCSTYINKEIKKLTKMKHNLIIDLHRLRKAPGKLRNPLIETTQTLINELGTQIQQEYYKSMNDFWRNRIQKINKDTPAQMFSQINALFRKKELANIDDLEIPISNQNLKNLKISTKNHNKKDKTITITNLSDKLNIIGKSFESVHKQNHNLGKKAIKTNAKQISETISEYKINSTITNFDSNNTSFNPKSEEIENYFINLKDLIKIFRKLNLKKSSGLDNIPNIALKYLPSKYIFYYNIIFNNLLNHMDFPKYWKVAKVIPLKKKGKSHKTPTNYRPISLLPNISKVYETVINKHLNLISKNLNIIPDQQFGFRYKHSTVHAINKLTSDVRWAQNAGKCVGAVLIDIEKAFDTASQHNILFKMHAWKFPAATLKITKNLMNNREFKVSCGGTITEETFTVHDGLQQGTVNAPLLFNILTSDLLNFAGQNLLDEIKSIAFADDYILYVVGDTPLECTSRLQIFYNKIIRWYSAWGLKTNPQKCEIILFRPKISDCTKQFKPKDKIFQLSGKKEELIKESKIVKYLGVHLDTKLTFNSHIKTQLEKARRAFFASQKLFFSKHLDSKVKIICYLLLIRPIITYACPIWYNLTASMMEKLRSFERKCLRKCLGMYKSPHSNFQRYFSNESLYKVANIPSIDSFIIKLTRDYFRDTRNVDDNSLINTMLYPHDLYHEITTESGYIPPEAFPYLDNKRCITDNSNYPIIYLIGRNNSKIEYSPVECVHDSNEILSYKPTFNAKNNKKLNPTHYWWLE